MFLTQVLPLLPPLSEVYCSLHAWISPVSEGLVSLLPGPHPWVKTEAPGTCHNMGSKFNPRAAMEELFLQARAFSRVFQARLFPIQCPLLQAIYSGSFIHFSYSIILNSQPCSSEYDERNANLCSKGLGLSWRHGVSHYLSRWLLDFI